MRIPITMCHGIRREDEKPLTPEHLDSLLSIASEMGFESINYNDLSAWRDGMRELPKYPIMLDFDHPVRSMRYEVYDILREYGYKGNLFVYTAPLDPALEGEPDTLDGGPFMTWAEIGELKEEGWQIGAHTVSHPNLSDLSVQDPSGERLRGELDDCIKAIQSNLGFRPLDFAFTGTSWSSAAEREVKKRFRFGRLWIIGSEYKVDGELIRYAELTNIDGPDELDGGPPNAARYISRDSNPYRLPSMELQGLIYEPKAFRKYLEMALE